MKIITPKAGGCYSAERLVSVNAAIRRWAMAGCLAAVLVSAYLTCDAHAFEIKDDMGRHITVTKPFKRIISLYPGHTENLFSLGLNAEIIGVSPDENYPAEVASKPVFSYHDDLEKFLAARPDLVLVRPMIDRAYGKLLAGLEKNGVTVVSLQPGAIESIYAYWQTLGELTGKTAQAEEMISHFKTALEVIRSGVRDIAPKKRVYFEAIHDRMKTFSPDSMAVFALESAGGVNVAADAAPVHGTNIAFYGKERIISHAADIDVYLAQSGPMNHVTVSVIQNEPGFSVIKAIREHQIYLIDEDLVSRPTLRLLDGIRMIAGILYPNARIK